MECKYEFQKKCSICETVFYTIQITEDNFCHQRDENKLPNTYIDNVGIVTLNTKCGYCANI